MYLKKDITNVYGDLANCLVITKADFAPIGNDLYQVTGNLSLYKDISSVGGKRMSDNFTFDYKLTQVELDGATTTILYNKIIESVIADKVETDNTDSVIADDVETNLLSGNIGEIGFQDAVIT